LKVGAKRRRTKQEMKDFRLEEQLKNQRTEERIAEIARLKQELSLS